MPLKGKKVKFSPMVSEEFWPELIAHKLTQICQYCKGIGKSL